MLRWYRDVHEPLAESGCVLAAEPGFDDRNEAVRAAREQLMLIPAPDFQALLTKLENGVWRAQECCDRAGLEIARQICADLVVLAAAMEFELRTASVSAHIGPDYTRNALAF